MSHSRYRESGIFVPTQWSYFSTTAPNGIFGTSFENGSKRTMWDTVTPGFRRRSLKGEVVMTPMQSSLQTKSASGSGCSGFRTGHASFWWRYDSFRADWCLPVVQGGSLIPETFLLHTGHDIAQLVGEVSTRCASNRFRGSTNSWENLAETGKTLETLKHPISSWYKFYRKSRLSTAVGSASNAYLAWRYGVQPLIRSTEDIMRAVEKSRGKTRFERMTARAYGSSSLSSSNRWTYGSTSEGLFTGTTSKVEQIEVRAMSLDSVIEDVGRRYGFASKDLLTLPYELIPYSFVVDWFVNVGDYIGAVSNCFYPAALGACHTIVANQSVIVANNTHSGTEWVATSPMIGSVSETCVQKFRTPGLPSPELGVRSNFRLDSLTRLADSFALIAQQALPLLRRKT